MLRLRQIFRIFDCEYAKYLLQKSAPLSSLAVSRESSLLRHERGLVRKIDFHMNNFCTNIEPATKDISEEPVTKKVLGKIARKLRLSFTCKRCGTSNAKTISKLSYEKGIVIVRCDGCKNNHLIADHLGWFATKQGSRHIENILAKREESICRIHNYAEGCIQVIDKKDYDEKLVEKDQTVREKLGNEEKDALKSL